MDFLKAAESAAKSETPAPEGMVAEVVDEENGPVVVRDKWDPAILKPLFDAFATKIDIIKRDAAILVVDSDEALAKATEMAGNSRKMATKIEGERKRLKAPVLEAGRIIDGFANPLVNTLIEKSPKSIIGILEKKMAPYLDKIEKERQEAAKKAREEAAKEQERLDEEARVTREAAEKAARERAAAEGKDAEEQAAAAAEAASEVGPAPTVVVDVVETIGIKTDSGSATLKPTFVGEITDLHQFLTENKACVTARAKFLIPACMPWLKAQIDAGVREIKGAKIWEVRQLKTRARR